LKKIKGRASKKRGANSGWLSTKLTMWGGTQEGPMGLPRGPNALGIYYRNGRGLRGKVTRPSGRAGGAPVATVLEFTKDSGEKQKAKGEWRGITLLGRNEHLSERNRRRNA